MIKLKRVVEKDDTGVIRKVGSKWKILKKNKKDYWDAEYDTKADAQAALRAYWANKGECFMSNHRIDRKSKLEAVKELNAGDMLLSYAGSEIDFDEMMSDVLSLLGIRNVDSLVLRVSDESLNSDGDEDSVLATGMDALEKFYETCQALFETGVMDVAVFLKNEKEITNYYEKLCLD